MWLLSQLNWKVHKHLCLGFTCEFDIWLPTSLYASLFSPPFISILPSLHSYTSLPLHDIFPASIYISLLYIGRGGRIAIFKKFRRVSNISLLTFPINFPKVWVGGGGGGGGKSSPTNPPPDPPPPPPPPLKGGLYLKPTKL